ncbi:hypothetical protein [Anabaena lutea]|uniref:Uncharacterized protein n=1 Tax=Anabaena lutea FACHB-196 TaxID=2692881 RepID=A0ABR8FEW2_9NOST|nr:hypothetical protein [Anabaena lutea]MBD2568365.1 hypothetical protein [Anabaena lutea FACHB-196]
MIPIKPAWEILPKAVNTSVDLLQEGLEAVSEMVDRIQGQQPGPNDAVLGGIEGRLKRIESDLLKTKNIANQALKKSDEALKKVENVFQTIGKISADLAIKTQEIATLKIDIKLLQAGLAALGKSIPFLLKSAILSWLFSEGLNLIISLLSKNGIDFSKILPLIQSAKDDARAAATIAVKAEGKAEKALTRAEAALENIKFLEKSALNAMKRLEAFIKDEIKFLTNSTKNALLRLQDRVIGLEKVVAGIKSSLSALQVKINELVASLNSQIKSINATIQKINADLLKSIEKINVDLLKTIENIKTEFLKALEKINVDLLKELNKLKNDFGGELNKIKSGVLQELQKLKPLTDKIPEILAKIATFSIEVAAIWLAINAIKAAIGALKVGVGKSVTIINNYTTNNYNNPDLGLLKKIDITTTANLALTKNVQAAVTAVSLKLVAGFKWLQLDRALNILTFAATVHNAAMLSNDIVQTLVGALTNVLTLIIPKDDAGNTFNVGEAINSTVENVIKGIVGETNYTNLSNSWAKANRIYQATSNVLNNVFDLGNTITNALEIVGGQQGRIGNALRIWGVVGEKAYNWMNPSPNYDNQILIKLEKLNQTASTVQMVTQIPLDVVNSVTQLTDSTTELVKAVNQDEGKKDGVKADDAKKIKQQQDTSKETLLAFPEIDITDIFNAND